MLREIGNKQNPKDVRLGQISNRDDRSETEDVRDFSIYMHINLKFLDIITSFAIQYK